VSELWVWILLYAVALVGLQLLVYYYYIRQDDTSRLTASATGDGNRSSKHHPPIGPDEDGGTSSQNAPSEPTGRQCRHCGAVNERDPMFRYCCECGQELSY